MVDNEKTRWDWIDQVKGLTIFLVVYGHNFPVYEKYVYSFHMPLFIMLSGFFHKNSFDVKQIIKRFKQIVFPYFIWAFLLFTIWYFVGRHFGETQNMPLSVGKNFIGIFYAQGGRDYMDWGIPLWFLPSIFMTYVFFSIAQLFKNQFIKYGLLLLMVLAGFIGKRHMNIHLPWSIDVALVSVLFYTLGNILFPYIQKIENHKALILFVLMGVLNVFFFKYNIKIDMYRSIYGNEGWFVFNGITGSLFVIFFFKRFSVFNFLGFVGKFSMVILVLQLLAMSFIKLVILLITHSSVFEFTETEKLVYSILQIIVLIPVFYLVNRYFPLLNGGYKKI